jgi:hypothetical protein
MESKHVPLNGALTPVAPANAGGSLHGHAGVTVTDSQNDGPDSQAPKPSAVESP